MRRLTTPTHTFTLPFDASVVDKFLLTYVQNDIIVLEKTGADVSVDGNVWSVYLTQSETKKFKPGVAHCQVRVLTKDGQAVASEVMTFAVTHVFNDDILESETEEVEE